MLAVQLLRRYRLTQSDKVHFLTQFAFSFLFFSMDLSLSLSLFFSIVATGA